MINIILAIVLSAAVAILFVSARLKWILTVSTIVIFGIISSTIAVNALLGNTYDILMNGTLLFGEVPIRVDALSGWFILVINFTMITGVIYGFSYMKSYRERKSENTLHCIAFIFVQFALVGICSVQNGFIFLLLWELMAISVFILVIFEHEKPETIKAGINYLVQSHFSIVFIMFGFI